MVSTSVTAVIGGWHASLLLKIIHCVMMVADVRGCQSVAKTKRCHSKSLPVQPFTNPKQRASFTSLSTLSYLVLYCCSEVMCSGYPPYTNSVYTISSVCLWITPQPDPPYTHCLLLYYTAGVLFSPLSLGFSPTHNFHPSQLHSGWFVVPDVVLDWQINSGKQSSKPSPRTIIKYQGIVLGSLS